MLAHGDFKGQTPMPRAVIALVICLLLPSIAQAERRVALVIGNSAYPHTRALANPRNDATDMAAALKKLGFQVIEGFDLDKASFDRKVRDFAEALSGASAGVFFYAGHGLQVSGVNYLVPVDAKLSTAAALDWEMVRLDLVQRTMERETQNNVLFLDACRDNPLARNLARAMGTRSGEIGRGLAATEAGVGTLISFSTQPGNVALDGKGRNSPFTGALVERIASSRSDLSALLIDVRTEVVKETQGKQVPWEHSALMGRFYFSAKPVPEVTEAAREWERVDKTSIAELQTFVRRHRASPEADYARARIEHLKQVAVAAPPKAVPQPGVPAQPVVAVTPAPAHCEGVEAVVGAKERRCLTPGDKFKDCHTCPEMVVVRAGEFVMGSPEFSDENQVHKVTIPKPFAVGRFEATFADWDACVAAGACTRKPSDNGWGRGSLSKYALGAKLTQLANGKDDFTITFIQSETFSDSLQRGAAIQHIAAQRTLSLASEKHLNVVLGEATDLAVVSVTKVKSNIVYIDARAAPPNALNLFVEDPSDPTGVVSVVYRRKNPDGELDAGQMLFRLGKPPHVNRGLPDDMFITWSGYNVEWLGKMVRGTKVLDRGDKDAPWKTINVEGVLVSEDLSGLSPVPLAAKVRDGNPVAAHFQYEGRMKAIENLLFPALPADNKNLSRAEGSPPVINVSWNDVTREYLPWLSRKTGKTYRLLSEAEWEYAARAGGQSTYAWGDEVGRDRANCSGCGSRWDDKQTASVGSFAANAFGLHDMHGNVREWVEDCWRENYRGAPTDGSAWVSACDGTWRVLRGGSWMSDPRDLRSTRRDRGAPNLSGSNDVGFRVARTLN